MDAIMTRISSNNKLKIKERDMTPREIVEFLEKGAVYRSFTDMLEAVYQGDNLKKTLTEELAQMLDARPESVARNVRNWLNKSDSNMPRREQLFQICFALKLNAADASKVIASASEMGIHYRNPDELVYAYCLDQNKSWQEAQELLSETREILREINADKKDGQGMEEPMYTYQLKKKFVQEADSDEKLKRFFWEYGHAFGELHETVYHEFLRLLKCLQDPENGYCDDEYKRMKQYPEEYSREEREELEKRWQGAQKMSVEEIMDKMMRMHVPVNTTRKKGIHRQAAEKNEIYFKKVIRKNWPSADILQKMQSRKMDVSRKVLLLLFLVTEEFEVINTEEENTEEEESYGTYLIELEQQETAGDRMEKRLMRINLFLDQYGMNRLDPGSPFDCIVLYALRADLDDVGENNMHGRMEQVLKELFEEENDV